MCPMIKRHFFTTAQIIGRAPNDDATKPSDHRISSLSHSSPSETSLQRYELLSPAYPIISVMSKTSKVKEGRKPHPRQLSLPITRTLQIIFQFVANRATAAPTAHKYKASKPPPPLPPPPPKYHTQYTQRCVVTSKF